MNEYDKVINALADKLDKPAKYIIDAAQKQMNVDFVMCMVGIVVAIIMLSVCFVGLSKTYKSYKEKTWAYERCMDSLSLIGFIAIAACTVTYLISTLYIACSTSDMLQIILNPNMYLINTMSKLLK